MQELMKKLNIAKGTIYHYFSSKESLLESVVEDIIDKALQKNSYLKAFITLGTHLFTPDSSEAILLNLPLFSLLSLKRGVIKAYLRPNTRVNALNLCWQASSF